METNAEVGGASCCRFRMPTIPMKWLLFIDFAFTFGTTIVYFADIITDIITLKMYYDREWFHAFGFSIGFIIAPSILLAVLECQFLITTYGKNIKWTTVLLRTLLNVPFQLTVIWYHFKLSYKYMKAWLDHIRKIDPKTITEEDRKLSMSNLADVDDRANTMERRAIMSTEIPASKDNPPAAYAGNQDHTWWKQLTREEWLSHLNKMKLTESMLESLPQLLINLYLIVKHPDTPVIQYLSATLSYLSLCGGIVRFDKTRKDNEAERLMVDRTLLHSRAFATRLEWPQMLFLSLYKGCFLAARILVFVYFTVYFQVYVLIFIFIHWALLMGYLVYLWYPTDLHKKTRQLVQADYKFRAYMFLSQDFLSVFHNSLVGIFISVRPRSYAFLGQPYCYIFWFYFVYIIENIVLFLLPGVYFSIRDEEVMLLQYQYYIIMGFELGLNVAGAILCTVYYFSVHKMSTYTRNAYPQFTKLQKICCCSNLGPPVPKEWTVCKQAETSEIFYLRREKLKEYKTGYTTVVRANRKQGRNLECFIDERGKIFYAPRSKLFKKLPTYEEEEMVNLRREASRESLDDLGRDTPTSQPSRRPESRSTVRNERLVGEEPYFVSGSVESKPLLASPSQSTAPPLPSTPPRASTPANTESHRVSKRSNQSAARSKSPLGAEKTATPAQSVRSSARSQVSHSEPSKKSEPPSQRSSKREDIRNPTSSHTSDAKNDSSAPSKDIVQTIPPSQPIESPKNSERSGLSPKSSVRSEPKRSFSPENMWKVHKGNDRKSPHLSPRPSPFKGGNEKFPSASRDTRSPKSDRHDRKHSHKSESLKNKSSSSRHYDSRKRSKHGDERPHDRGDPEGQSWI